MSDVSLSPKAVAELRELQAKVGDNLLLAASDFTQKYPQFTDAEADWLAAINNAAPALLALASQSLLPNAELQAGLARAIQEAWHRGAFTAIDLQNGVAIARAIIESGVMPLAYADAALSPPVSGEWNGNVGSAVDNIRARLFLIINAPIAPNYCNAASDASLLIASQVDRIATLTQAIAEADKLIEPFVEYEKHLGGPDSDPVCGAARCTYISVGAFRAARAWRERWQSMSRSGGMSRSGAPTINDPDCPYCKADQSCCDFTCGN